MPNVRDQIVPGAAVGISGPATPGPTSGLTLGRPAFPAWKRRLDIVLGLPLLACSTPILAATAVANRLSGDGGPLFYRALRVGEGGRPFHAIKLRTMRAGADGPAVTAAGDGRITPVGGFLRHAKLDELPQFWNVLRGQMSLVGPRPESPTTTTRGRCPPRTSL